jgi:hypothetical protein
VSAGSTDDQPERSTPDAADSVELRGSPESRQLMDPEKLSDDEFLSDIFDLAGVVYRAREEGLGRIVALKCLAPSLMASARSRERFVVEVWITVPSWPEQRRTAPRAPISRSGFPSRSTSPAAFARQMIRAVFVRSDAS